MDHPFRNMIRCAECKRTYTPYLKKGHIYFGSRCARGCNNHFRSFNLTLITRTLESLIGNLTFTKEELDDIDSSISTEIATLDKKRIDLIESNERKKKKVREDLAYLNANRLTLLRTGAYTPEKIKEEEDSMNLALKSFRDQEEASDISMAQTVKEVIKLSELIKDTLPHYSLCNSYEKEQIVKIIFSELSFSGKTLNFKTKNGFQSLENRLKNHFVTNCGPTGNRTRP